jgi:endonuclease III
LAALFEPEMYSSAHLNLIRLGREVCHARKPNCPSCPIRRLCDFESKTVSPSKDSLASRKSNDLRQRGSHR